MIEKCSFQVKFSSSWLLAIFVVMITTPAIAQTANFSTLKLLPGFNAAKGMANGYTGGSYSLSAMRNRDQDKNACVGFATPDPDHIMILEKDFEHLKILVNTGGADTTLLIQGSDETTFRCGDDTGKSKDASVDDSKWQSGTYRIWVGTFNRSTKLSYTLKVQQ